ncbi:MAG: hypothetical protein JWN31_93 [Frankiales bacterium]|nr:hypothetical protein [Frankiales bacterium]
MGGDRTAGERELLEGFLTAQRDEIAGLLDGLTSEQVRRRLVTSSTTLLGLVKHAAFVERVWSDVAFLGRSRAELGLPDDVDDSFQLTEEDTIAFVGELYARARADAEAVFAGLALDDVALHNRRSPMSLRWVYLHLTAELARHAGHGDILREQLLTRL